MARKESEEEGGGEGGRVRCEAAGTPKADESAPWWAEEEGEPLRVRRCGWASTMVVVGEGRAPLLFGVGDGCEDARKACADGVRKEEGGGV